MEGDFGLLPLSKIKQEVRSLAFYRDVLCEATISFVLLFVDSMVASAKPGFFTVGFVSGLYVFLLIEAFGHVQGALQNPVVTLSFVCTRRLTALRGVLYILAQIAGGTAGAMASAATMSPEMASKIRAFSPGHEVEHWQACISDGVITAGLIFITLGALDEKRRKVFMPGFPIGLALALGIIAGGPVCGGVMNPCIATSFANLANNYEHLWIYWLGDYVGGGLAIFLYWFYTCDITFNKSEKTGSKALDAITTKM